MEQIQKLQLTKATQLLDLLGVPYAVEIDGVMTGPLASRVIAPANGRTKQHSFTNYTASIVDMKVGEVLCIVMPENVDFKQPQLASAVSARGIQTFGKGNFTTHDNRAKKQVECMRLA